MGKTRKLKGKVYRGKAVFNDCKVGTNDGGAGYIEGYASTFGNVDGVGDRVLRGAFTKTIREAVPAGKVSLQTKHFVHGGDLMQSVGVVVDAQEDDKGLWVRAEFDEDEMSQAVRGKVAARLGKNRPVALSIGYRVVKARETIEDERIVFELAELKLHEVTLTLNPANEEALIGVAKSLDDSDEESVLSSLAHAVRAVQKEEDLKGSQESLEHKNDNTQDLSPSRPDGDAEDSENCAVVEQAQACKTYVELAVLEVGNPEKGEER